MDAVDDVERLIRELQALTLLLRETEDRIDELHWRLAAAAKRAADGSMLVECTLS
jgi:hypothetical protein